MIMMAMALMAIMRLGVVCIVTESLLSLTSQWLCYLPSLEHNTNTLWYSGAQHCDDLMAACLRRNPWQNVTLGPQKTQCHTLQSHKMSRWDPRRHSRHTSQASQTWADHLDPTRTPNKHNRQLQTRNKHSKHKHINLFSGGCINRQGKKEYYQE